MKQNEFLDLLMRYLHQLPKEEVHDIIQDYKEHFQVGLSKGKSEEEIAKELGDPRTIARGFIEASDLPRENPVKSNNFMRNLAIVAGVFIGLVVLIIALNAAVFRTFSDEDGTTGSEVRVGDNGLYVKGGDREVRIGSGGINVVDGNEEVNIGWIDVDDDKSELEKFTIEETQTASIEGVYNIVIASSFIDIDVISDSRDEIAINYQGTMEANVKPSLEIDKSSNTLIIKLETPDNQAISVRNLQAVLEVIIPETYEENLSVASSSGDISIRDLNVYESLVSTSSGDINIENLTNNGDMMLNSSSGDIILTIGLDLDYKIVGVNASGDFVTNSNINVVRNSNGIFEASIGNGENIIDITTSSGDVIFNTP